MNDSEMLKTFNCGIGMIIIINKKDLSVTHSILKSEKQVYKIMGQIIKKPAKSKIIYVD